MPALLNRMSSRDSDAVNAFTAGLIVVKSWRESKRKTISPGEVAGRALIFEIADCALASERPASL